MLSLLKIICQLLVHIDETTDIFVNNLTNMTDFNVNYSITNTLLNMADSNDVILVSPDNIIKNSQTMRN